MKLRLGVVGLGPNWATRHLPALQSLAGRFEVRAVCDPVTHRAEQVAAELGARPTEGFRALAASEDVDALLVLSARWFGSLPVLAACDHSKAVYCGATVDLAADEARRLRDRVRDAGVAFMAEFPCRLAPATIRLKELIATRLGQPQLLFCNQRATADKPNGHNRAAVSDTRRLTEMVDWCRYIIGREAIAVQAASHEGPHTGGREDYTLLTLDFSPPPEGGALPEERPNGVSLHHAAAPMAQISCGSYVPQAWSEAAAFRRPADLQVTCERGIAFVDLPNKLVWFDDAGQHTESLEADRPIGEQLLVHFHRTVESLVLKHSNLDDAYRAVSLVIAARQSHAEGRRIECPST